MSTKIETTTGKLSKKDRKEYTKQYYAKNRDKINAQFREKYHTNKDEFKAKYEANKELYLTRNKKSNEKNKEKRLEYYAKYYKENKERILIRTKNNHQKRFKNDLQYRLKKTISNRIREMVKYQNAYKAGKTYELIGCTVEQLKEHIESQWLPGMSWNNHTNNGWHIDHIKPCNTFDLTDPKQQKQCFHYTNLRPLWAKDNLSRPKNGCDLL